MTWVQCARKFLRAALTLIPVALAPWASAVTITGHVTDGAFTSPTEWTGNNVNKSFFAPAAGGSGNAWLYVEQSNGILYLMYDYVGNTVSQNSNSFFNVFFQVDGNDYGVHITPGGFTAFEKPVSILSPLNPDGSFNFNASPPWSAISQGDLALGQLQAKLGFGMSQNLSTPHWMAEFQLTINSAKSGPQNGLYSPAPSFWSASTGGGFNAASLGSDPPITSAIFTLNPDGTTTVVPDLRNGAPILEDAATPEPATAWMLAFGALALLVLRKLRGWRTV